MEKYIVRRNVLHSWMLTNPESNQSRFTTLLILSDHREDWKKKKKTRGSRELLLSENNFQTSSTVRFLKNIHILETWKPNKDLKFKLEFFSHALLHMNSV